MVRLAISVEGPTEERFINKVLGPHLQRNQIHTIPILLGGRGGGVSLSKVKKDLNKIANNFDKVTTLYDFYGFRGKVGDETKAALERRILDSVATPLQDRILPYVQMYEFEGLLFSSPEAMENAIQKNGVCKWAQRILDEFDGNPENINDSEQTAPSKRLLQVDYIKTIHGPEIIKEIGLDVLRKRCTGFGAWLTQLEKLQ